MRHLVVIAATIILAGCNASWTKPGASPNEADAASVACMAETYRNAAKPGVPMPPGSENYLLAPDRPVDPGAEARNAAFASCMAAKGYARGGLESVAQTAPQPAPAAPAPARAKEAPGQRAGDECDALIGDQKYVNGHLSADYLTCFDTRYEEYSRP